MTKVVNLFGPKNDNERNGIYPYVAQLLEEDISLGLEDYIPTPSTAALAQKRELDKFNNDPVFKEAVKETVPYLISIYTIFKNTTALPSSWLTLFFVKHEGKVGISLTLGSAASIFSVVRPYEDEGSMEYHKSKEHYLSMCTQPRVTLDMNYYPDNLESNQLDALDPIFLDDIFNLFCKEAALHEMGYRINENKEYTYLVYQTPTEAGKCVDTCLCIDTDVYRLNSTLPKPKKRFIFF